MPERVERQFFAVFSFGKNRLWQNGKTATHTGEATSLGEAAKLDRAFARSINFENRVRNLRVNPHLTLRAFLSETHSCALTAACACVSLSGREWERIEVRADIGFVSGIEQQKRIMVPRVLDPTRQFRTRLHRAGWIGG